jgi:drug/metabolite transporter (DMT)-like permease
MTPDVFLLTIASTVLGGIAMFTSKMIAVHKGDTAVNSFLQYSVSGVIALCAFVMNPVVPAAWASITFFAVVSGVMHGVGNMVRTNALHYIDSTIYFPLNKVLGPLFVFVCGVLLFKESLTQAQLFGVVLSLCVPLLLITASEHHRQNNLQRGLIFVVISTLLTAGSMLFVKAGAEAAESQIFMMLVSQIGGTFISYLAYAQQHKKHLSLRSVSSKHLLIGATSGVAGGLSFYLLLLAFHSGYISLVYTIHAHYILIPIFLSVWWYGEHINLRKFAAVVLSCVTLTLLY